MTKSQIIARQSAHPRGLLGHVVARVMALDTAATNRRVLGCVEPAPGEIVLELGCGHGRTLRRAAEGVSPGGIAVGVDPSDVMCGVARHHNRRLIDQGRVRVEAGSSDHIPEKDGTFDKAFSVHTLYFWPHLERGLRELRRVLRPGGELFIAFHTADDPTVAARFPTSVYTLRTGSEVGHALAEVGFENVTTPTLSGSGVVVAHGRA
jgi:ubiquinone/menaquinone biosynthesis C-methylase UbiE